MEKKNKSANVVVINGNQYEVEIYLINDPCEPGGIVPIPYSSLKYLEISNDLANIGYYGKVEFVNFNDVLDDLGVLKASKNTPLMYFRLKSLMFDNKTTYDDIYFNAALTTGQDIKENEIEGFSAYNFEELYIFKLKTTKLLRKDNQQFNYNGFPNTISGHIKNILLFNIPTVSDVLEYAGGVIAGVLEGTIPGGLPADSGERVKLLGQIIDPIIRKEIIEPGRLPKEFIPINAIVTLETKATLFKALNELYPYLSYGDQNDKIPGDPGVIKLENNNSNDSTRTFVMFPLLKTINSFFKAVNSGNSVVKSDYFNNFLLEKFNISQKDSAPVFSSNTITKYELKRVDVSNVFENKWMGVQSYYGSPSSKKEGNIFEYQKLRDEFEKQCTSPFSSNLPVRGKDDVQVKEYIKAGIGSKIAIDYGTNSVLKSFVLDNVMATFRVSGQPYRKPNRFISINLPQNDKEIDGKSEKEKLEIQGYWYVLSVNHVFIDGNYFNDFECVKLYGGGDDTSRVSEEPIPRANTVNEGGLGTEDIDVNSGPGSQFPMSPQLPIPLPFPPLLTPLLPPSLSPLQLPPTIVPEPIVT